MSRTPWAVVRQRLAAAAAQRSVTEGAEHVYLSTSCLHGLHEYCQADKIVDSQGTRRKNPSSCKFCKAPCVCTCHGEGETWTKSSTAEPSGGG